MDGVSALVRPWWKDPRRRWLARKQLFGQSYHLGYYQTPEDAQEAIVEFLRRVGITETTTVTERLRKQLWPDHQRIRSIARAIQMRASRQYL
jgi:hypothetical protein